MGVSRAVYRSLVLRGQVTSLLSHLNISTRSVLLKDTNEPYNLLMKLAIAILSGILLSGCSSSPTADVEYGLLGAVEIWPGYFEKTGNGNCKGINGNNFDGSNFENKATLVLVGPDDSELSATSFETGFLTQTQVDESEVTIFPDEVCRFSFVFEFEEYPKVATFRLKYRDGSISSVSWPLSDVLKTGEIIMSIGADYKD